MVCTRSGTKVAQPMADLSSSSDDDDFDDEAFECRARDEGVPNTKSARHVAIRKVSFSKQREASKKVSKQAQRGALFMQKRCSPCPEIYTEEGMKTSLQGTVVTNGTSKEPFRTRFSVHRINDLVSERYFNDQQIEWIEDAGFGALLFMSEVSIPVKLVDWIMKHTDQLRRNTMRRRHEHVDAM